MFHASLRHRRPRPSALAARIARNDRSGIENVEHGVEDYRAGNPAFRDARLLGGDCRALLQTHEIRPQRSTLLRTFYRFRWFDFPFRSQSGVNQIVHSITLRAENRIYRRPEGDGCGMRLGVAKPA